MSLGYSADIDFPTADGDGGTSGPIKTANTAMDGTGTVNTLVTGATNGTQVFKLRFKAAGGNNKTVARIFLNKASPSSTATNNVLVGEVSLPETVAKDNEALPEVVVPSPITILPSGKKLLLTLGKTVVGGWYVSVDKGDLPP